MIFDLNHYSYLYNVFFFSYALHRFEKMFLAKDFQVTSTPREERIGAQQAKLHIGRTN